LTNLTTMTRQQSIFSPERLKAAWEGGLQAWRVAFGRGRVAFGVDASAAARTRPAVIEPYSGIFFVEGGVFNRRGERCRV
jgi:hypothetical protein